MSSPYWLEIATGEASQFEIHWLWLIFCLLIYPLLGWLFGSFTVLALASPCFPRVAPAFVDHGHGYFLMVVAIARWLVNPGDEVWLVSRQVQIGLVSARSRLGRF